MIDDPGNCVILHMLRAVRQGCTLAPLLWLVFSTYLRRQLTLQLPADWVHPHLTLFADDTHASFVTNSIEDLKFAFRAIQTITIFEVYSRRRGMKVNPSKSGIVLGVRGHTARDFLCTHVQGTDDKCCLAVGIGSSELRIPVKPCMTYLGICVSYGNFEPETLDHRLRAAQATRCRWAKVLGARKYLTLTQRLQLYILCVRSAALYGLGPTGLTSACLRRLQVFEVEHLRALARSPVRLTRKYTSALYARLQIRTSVQQLLCTLEGRIGNSLDSEAGHRNWIRDRYQRLLELLQLQAAGMQEAPSPQEIACPILVDSTSAL